MEGGVIFHSISLSCGDAWKGVIIHLEMIMTIIWCPLNVHKVGSDIDNSVLVCMCTLPCHRSIDTPPPGPMAQSSNQHVAPPLGSLPHLSLSENKAASSINITSHKSQANIHVNSQHFLLLSHV